MGVSFLSFYTIVNTGMLEIVIGVSVVLVILIVLYFVHNESLLAKEVSLKDARKGLAAGKFRSVVDVRSPTEYQGGHYPDAVSFPLNTINQQTVSRKEISERIYSPVLVYCKSGKRAKEGAELMAQYGLQDVYYVNAPYWKLSNS